MKSARHQLILLGFICQAFSWDDFFLPLVSAGLWVLCLKLPGKAIRLNQITEVLLIWVGIAAGHFFADMTGKRLGFFVFGYGLTLIQAARLLRPLNRGEKIFSILIACFQVGVASTIVLDYRFILIFFAALVLVPRALAELESESYVAPGYGVLPSGGAAINSPAGTSPLQPPKGGTPYRFRFSFKGYAAIVLITAAFYILFPRGGPQLPAPRFGSQYDTTLLDSMIDPTRGGSANDDRVLLQIEGELVGYLRCFALVDFDGEKWTPETWDMLQGLPGRPQHNLEKYKHRRVRVKNSNHLGKILPTDGRVFGVEGKFFRAPATRDQHNIVKTSVMWNTANNFYEYWMDPAAKPQGISARHHKLYTKHPAQSERLRKWLDQSLEGTKTPLEQARRLEDFFQRNFTYKIGAPRLSRVNTADDFIFNQREGHCERFATHLALLLRMKGIPSRVVVGYLPNTKSWFTGRYNVRFRDAHAWTEGWFEDEGWVLLDATPAADMDRSGNRLRELLDALDFMWYSKVVALDAPAQTRMLNSTLHFFQVAATWLNQNKFILAIPPLLALLWFAPKVFRRLRLARVPPRQRSVIVAEHCYGQMLRLLAKRGFHREPQQTPFEFLEELEKKAVPFLEDAQFITRSFCAARYGANVLSSGNVEMEDSLRRLKKSFQR